jgi:hypothetical protein
VLDRPAGPQRARDRALAGDWCRRRPRRRIGAQLLVLCGQAAPSAPGPTSPSSTSSSRMRRRASAFAPLCAPGSKPWRRCRSRTMAWIDGPCFGAGVALAMAADIRVASPAASFAITPAKMGIGYPQEDIARLVDLVGPGLGRPAMLFTGEAIRCRGGGADRPCRGGGGQQTACESLSDQSPPCDSRQHRHAEARHRAWRGAASATDAEQTAASTSCWACRNGRATVPRRPGEAGPCLRRACPNGPRARLALFALLLQHAGCVGPPRRKARTTGR